MASIFRIYPNGYAQEVPSAILSVDESQVTEAKTVILSASAYYDHVIGEQIGSDKVDYIKAQLDDGGIFYIDLMEQGQELYL